MIDILIVDDENLLDIEECVQQKGSILKDKCRMLKALAVTKFTGDLAKVYGEKDTALYKIKTAKNIDLALLDIGFPDEAIGEAYYEPLIAMIHAISAKHPHCQVMILSSHMTEQIFKEKHQVGKTKIFVPAVSKEYKNTPLEEYNRAYTFLLEKRLSSILNHCSESAKEGIVRALKGNTDSTDFIIGGKRFTLDSLFLNYTDAKFNVDKNAALTGCFNVLIDRPKYKESEWLTMKGKEDSGAVQRRFGLRDYYHDYYKYYYDEPGYTIEEIVQVAQGEIRGMLDEMLVEKVSSFSKEEFDPESGIPAFRLKTALKLPKIDDRIDIEDIQKFRDFLLKRLLALGMYFCMNLSNKAIMQLLQSRIAANNSSNYKWFYQFLYIHIRNQLSTQTDSLVNDFAYLDKKEIQANRTTGNQTVRIKLFETADRRYSSIFGPLAQYEKKFIADNILHALKLNPANDLKDHLEFIKKHVTHKD